MSQNVKFDLKNKDRNRTRTSLYQSPEDGKLKKIYMA